MLAQNYILPIPHWRNLIALLAFIFFVDYPLAFASPCLHCEQDHSCEKCFSDRNEEMLAKIANCKNIQQNGELSAKQSIELKSGSLSTLALKISNVGTQVFKIPIQTKKEGTVELTWSMDKNCPLRVPDPVFTERGFQESAVKPANSITYTVPVIVPKTSGEFTCTAEAHYWSGNDNVWDLRSSSFSVRIK